MPKILLPGIIVKPGKGCINNSAAMLRRKSEDRNQAADLVPEDEDLEDEMQCL
jgi:hypothetical protein